MNAIGFFALLLGQKHAVVPGYWRLKHVAILAIPTIGFPQAVKGLTWIEDVIRSG